LEQKREFRERKSQELLLKSPSLGRGQYYKLKSTQLKGVTKKNFLLRCPAKGGGIQPWTQEVERGVFLQELFSSQGETLRI